MAPRGRFPFSFSGIRGVPQSGIKAYLITLTIRTNRGLRTCRGRHVEGEAVRRNSKPGRLAALTRYSAVFFFGGGVSETRSQERRPRVFARNGFYFGKAVYFGKAADLKHKLSPRAKLLSPALLGVWGGVESSRASAESIQGVCLKN